MASMVAISKEQAKQYDPSWAWACGEDDLDACNKARDQLRSFALGMNDNSKIEIWTHGNCQDGKAAAAVMLFFKSNMANMLSYNIAKARADPNYAKDSSLEGVFKCFNPSSEIAIHYVNYNSSIATTQSNQPQWNFPSDPKDKYIFVLDFCYDLAATLELIKQAKHVMIIDHHPYGLSYRF